MALSLKTKITTPRLDETAGFYRRLFGMVDAEVWDDPGDRGVILAFADGREEAYLEVYDGPESPDYAGFSLQFRVDDLDAFLARVPADIQYEGPKPRPWGSTYAYFRDPNEILVIVYEGGL